jgi:hypothetical protein
LAHQPEPSSIRKSTLSICHQSRAAIAHDLSESLTDPRLEARSLRIVHYDGIGVASCSVMVWATGHLHKCRGRRANGDTAVEYGAGATALDCSVRPGLRPEDVGTTAPKIAPVLHQN